MSSDDYGLGGAVVSLAERQRIDRDLEQFQENLRHKQKKRKTKHNKHQRTKPVISSPHSPDPQYTDLLYRAYSARHPMKNIHSINEDLHPKVSIPAPMIAKRSRKTIWLNIIQICKTLRRDPNHMKQFIESELIINSQFSGEMHLILRGRFNERHITKILRKYIQQYISCANCLSLCTTMTRNSAMRLYEIQCNKCKSSRCCERIEKAPRLIITRQQRIQQRQRND